MMSRAVSRSRQSLLVTSKGCLIFKNSEEVRLCHPGRGGTWVVIVSSRFPSFEPARESEKVILWLLPVEESIGEPELNVIGSSD